MDIARSPQDVLEEILIEKARYLWSITGCDNLCMAGGVALNCVANGKVLRHGPFKELFVPPAAGDAGGCVGAAAIAFTRLTEASPSPRPLEDAYLGPAYSPDEFAHLLTTTSLTAADYRSREDSLLDAVVELLASRNVVGWFHGRMEFGPRALSGSEQRVRYC